MNQISAAADDDRLQRQQSRHLQPDYNPHASLSSPTHDYFTAKVPVNYHHAVPKLKAAPFARSKSNMGFIPSSAPVSLSHNRLALHPVTNIALRSKTSATTTALPCANRGPCPSRPRPRSP
jgi:hypothetical protein